MLVSNFNLNCHTATSQAYSDKDGNRAGNCRDWKRRRKGTKNLCFYQNLSFCENLCFYSHIQCEKHQCREAEK